MNLSVQRFQPTYPQPEPLQGFEHIKRYWDPKHGVYAAKILPGQFYVSKAGELVATVLGSCVSACIRDPINAIGGMNHFMLPINQKSSGSESTILSGAARYGNWAMEYLINSILANGGRKENLEVKIFGGGKVISEMHQAQIGEKNIEFILQYLCGEGLPIAAQDLAGIYPRKVLYFSDTGSVKVKRLRDVKNDTVYKREISYSQNINNAVPVGSIELFD